jgi:uncharacterized membrane protein
VSNLAGAALRRAYRIGIAVKGIDGAVELLAGLALWIFPQALVALVHPLAGPVSGDHPIRNFVGYWAGRMDHDLSNGPDAFVVLFLLAHGVVKVVLVYCLYREYHWVYPYGIAVLALFAVYQVYVLIRTPTIGLALFLVLDVVIIWLVWREWRELRTRAGQKQAA